MYDRTASKIEAPSQQSVRIAQASTRPNPVSDGAINKCSPHNAKQHHCVKLDPFGKGTADDGGRNRKEHPLKKHMGAHRNRGVLARRSPHRRHRLHCQIIPSPRNPVLKEILPPSDPWIERPAVGKRQRLAVQTPNDRHHGRQEQALD